LLNVGSGKDIQRAIHAQPKKSAPKAKTVERMKAHAEADAKAQEAPASAEAAGGEAAAG